MAGNSLGKISSKVFLPTKDITELDLSDCSLRSIWVETNLKDHSKNIFKNLKTLNVSNNEIIHVRQTELEVMDNLSVLDLSNNEIQCDDQFLTLMKWLDNRRVSNFYKLIKMYT